MRRIRRRARTPLPAYQLTARREARQQELAAAAERLEGLATEAADDLRVARDKARKAGLTVRRLRRAARHVLARAAEGARARVAGRTRAVGRAVRRRGRP